MSVESDQDRLNYLDPELFGVEAVYTPRRGDDLTPVAIVGIYDEPASTFDPARFMGGPPFAQQQGAKFLSTAPTFHCRRSDLPDGGRQNATLVVDGRTFRVEEPKSDGTGMIVLILREAE